MVETSDEWIRERTGIAERHVSVGETVVTLASEAARKALEQAGKRAEEIDLILVATCSPEQYLPCCACQVQADIGAVNALAFDVNAACSGFLFALNTADAYLRMGLAENALIIGSEVLSKLVDWTDRGSCILFGDGAGAVVVEQVQGRVPSGGGETDTGSRYFGTGAPFRRYRRWRLTMRCEGTDNPLCKDFGGKNRSKPADGRQRAFYSDGWTGSVSVRH